MISRLLLGASRRPIISKDGNKNFYKGVGAANIGSFNKLAKANEPQKDFRRYNLDPQKFIVYQTPKDFKLKPYYWDESK